MKPCNVQCKYTILLKGNFTVIHCEYLHKITQKAATQYEQLSLQSASESSKMCGWISTHSLTHSLKAGQSLSQSAALLHCASLSFTVHSFVCLFAAFVCFCCGFDASTLRRFDASTLRRFDASTLRRFDASTLFCFRFDASTLCWYFDASTLRRFVGTSTLFWRFDTLLALRSVDIVLCCVFERSNVHLLRGLRFAS